MDDKIRTVGKERIEKNHKGLSLFKEEFAEYIKRKTIVNADYQDEIDK